MKGLDEFGVFNFLKIIIFLSFFHAMQAHGMLFPSPGTEPAPPALAAQSLSHWTTRKIS